MARLLVSLRILRKQYNTKLRVEIFSFPGEIQDTEVLKQLEELDAVVKEVGSHISLTNPPDLILLPTPRCREKPNLTYGKISK